MNPSYKIPILKFIKFALIAGILILALLTTLFYFLDFEKEIIEIFSIFCIFMIIADSAGYAIISKILTRPNRLITSNLFEEAVFADIMEATYRGKKSFTIIVKTPDGKEYKSHKFDFDPKQYIKNSFRIYFDEKNKKIFFVDTREIFYAKGQDPTIPL